MTKKTIYVFLTLILLFTISCSVFADTITDDASKLKQVQETKKDLQSNVQALDKEINDVLKKIDVNKKAINTLALKIKNNQTKLDNEEKSIKLQTTLMNKRLRALYICGGTGYLEVILDSNSFSDFLSRVTTISKIMKYDKELIANIEEQKEAETKQKESLNSQNTDLAVLKTENSNTLNKLLADIKKQNDLLSKATTQEKQIIADQKAKELAAKKARELAQAAVSKNSTSLLASPASGAPKAGSYSKSISVDATAYSGFGCTTIGSQVTRNPNGTSTIAVDPQVIPLYSKVYVSGYGYAIAADTGSAIQGNIIDVYFSTEAEANDWGRRSVQVYILN